MKPLSKQDVNALRKCDDWYFHHIDGEGIITLVKHATWEDKQRDPFVEDKKYEIKVHSRIHAYGKGQPNYEQAHCYYGPYSLAQLQTIARVLKEGDDLELRWSANCGSNLLKHAVGDNMVENDYQYCFQRLYLDMLELHAFRPRKRGEAVQYCFLIGEQVSSDNTARMIRHVEYRINVA